jgi:hypothetical protein
VKGAYIQESWHQAWPDPVDFGLLRRYNGLVYVRGV